MRNDSLNQIAIIVWFKSWFKPIIPIEKGDIGIYCDSLSFGTSNDGIQTVKYDIFTKVRTVGVYDELVEVEVVDVFTMNTTNDSIKDVVSSTIPKYIHPKYIKWEVKL